MLEKPKIKRVERQEKQVPNSIEQLIEYYSLERLWPCINEIIEHINEKEISQDMSSANKYDANKIY